MIPSSLSGRMRRLQWAMPLGIAVLTTVFQLVVVRWIHDQIGHSAHWTFEVLFYGTVGPIVIWFGLGLIRKWLNEKEEAEAEVYRLNQDLTRRVDERTRELSQKNKALADANSELQQLDRMKSEFVSLVSHELRAPLTNMRSALELIEGSGDPNISSTLEIISEQASRLTRLVDEVLNVSRIEAGGMSVAHADVDMLQAVDHVIDEFTGRKTGHKLRRPQGQLHPHVWADPDYLYQVIANLVDNAIKYSSVGSEIKVSIDVRDGQGVVSVTDRGPGIPPGDHDHIFEKFHRLDTGDSKETYGYGLGLYICRRLVEAMKGRIWVESRPTQGATFKVSLPLAST